MDKCKIGLRYNVVSPPYTGNFMPLKSNLVYPSLDDFVDVNESVINIARPFNTVQSRTTVNNAGPMKNIINNAHSTARRPFNEITSANNSNFTKKVNTVKGTRVNTARPKAVISAIKGNKGNVVKASACWVWRPKHKILDHGNPQQDLKNKGVIDSGCSRHMTGNRSYLTNYEEIDGGFVAFGGNSKGGKITGKGAAFCLLRFASCVLVYQRSNVRFPGGVPEHLLDRNDFASWQQRIRLYCRGKENGVNILKSIDEGPFQMGTFRETLAEGDEGALHLGPKRPRVYSDLSPEDKDRYNADIRATNILLQGLPKDIYSLINHYTDAKDIWDNVKMLLEGSELTKEDRESQLYDDFEHFRQHKGETIHDYYVWFAKLINDMRNIKMTMSRMQLNSKFVNNMLPEWGRFVTAVKLNRGLRDSNYDQLYAYLKQHEAHANENKMMLDRFTQHTVDPLALMSNVAPQQYNSQSSTNPSSTYVPPHFADNSQLDSGLSPTDNLIENLTNTLALLTQSYKTYLPQTNNQLRTSSNPRNQATVQDGRVVVQNVQGRQNRGQGNNARGAGTAGYGGALNRVGNANPGQARQVKCYNCNGIGHIARNCTQPKRPQNSEYFKDKMLLMQAQENGVALDEEQLLFLAGGQDNAVDEDVDEQPVQDLALNVDNVFQADDCDAFDSDVDEAPTAQTMFMANLSSADPVYDEAGPSYDSDILSEVHDHDHYQDAVCEHHEEHEMHDDVQPNYVVDSHADYTSNSNMIPYDQYVKDNAVPVVQSNVSSVTNDAYMMIYNDMCEPHAQSVSKTTRNIVVDNSLTAELETYKEQVELYERRAMFELTEREQKIDEQLRIVITDQEVTSLKKDFKQKENKYLEEFLDMKALKEKVAISYKNPLCLTCAKKVQPALYNGYEIVKNNYVPAIVHNTEDNLEIAEITRRKMHDKMKDPKCVTHKVKIAPPDYSKENYLATFTPQKQLTLEQIFWSQDIIKMKAKALKEQTSASRPTKALTVYPPNTPATLVPRVLPTKKIFEELEAEVDQHIVHRKHDEIERKNILIANDNLIVDCLFKDVFHVATNSELNVSSFTEMHDAHTSLKARCLELEVELSNLRDKIQKDNHDELIKRFSNLEVNHLNLQLKYQNLKESFGNDTSPPTRDVPDFDLVFVIEKMKASIQGKDNAIKKLRMQISQLNETRSEAGQQNELFMAENGKIKRHYKELYNSIKITHAKHLEETTALLTNNESLKVQIHNKLSCVNKDHVKPKVLAPGKYVIDVEPIPPLNRNNREVHLVYLKHLKESVETLCEIVEEAKVERPLDSSLASAFRYTKHSQELLEYVIGTCPKALNTRDNKHASTSLPKK
ncbi:retrovirus-related pol polyprotein from transposon TNT 1-94 [Tanacetum coccineum]